jgi:hypothetical protein
VNQKIFVGCNAAIAGKPVPTGIREYLQNRANCQAAFASKPAHTEKQKQKPRTPTPFTTHQAER